MAETKIVDPCNTCVHRMVCGQSDSIRKLEEVISNAYRMEVTACHLNADLIKSINIFCAHYMHGNPHAQERGFDICGETPMLDRAFDQWKASRHQYAEELGEERVEELKRKNDELLKSLENKCEEGDI